jgi:pyruvate dehydrogenase E2 component (dihydrolipoamide acetyltransferase)
METGVITQWLVKVGDHVKEGDVLAEIETDKATMQMKAYDEGTIVHIDHASGEEVALGQRVLVLAGKGEDPQQVATSLGTGPAALGTAASPSSPSRTAAPPARRPSPSPGPSPGPGRPSGTGPQTGNGQQSDQAQPDEDQDPGSSTHGLKISPLARKLAESARVDLARVRGSGPGGRIVRRDVEAFLEGQIQGRDALAAPATVAESPPAPSETEKPQEGAPPSPPIATTAARLPQQPSGPPTAAQRIPHSRMRKTIAARMVRAKQAAPEIHLSVDVRVDRLAAARDQLNQRLAHEGIKLSLGDFVTKAVALALRRHPGVNASFEADAIVRHGEVNLGIAVALKEGLIVPVLHRADTLGLREIRVLTEALTTAARASSLAPEQLTGSTFTISNLGMYGIRQFDAILNVPEAGILAVGAAEKRPVVEEDRLVIGTVMTVTLTADHRAVDGAMAAEFLRTLKGLLEEPTSMLL